MLILIKQNMNKIQIIIVLIYKITKDETTINFFIATDNNTSSGNKTN